MDSFGGNANKNSTVDCTKVFVDEPRLAYTGGGGWLRGLSIAGHAGVSERSPPGHRSYTAPPGFQIHLIHN